MRPDSLDYLKPVATGPLHTPFACAFCGAAKDLRARILDATRSQAAVCVDTIACIRRQLKGKAA